MGLVQQARRLTGPQQERLLAHVATTRTPARDTVLVLLSYKCGLRAIEMGAVRWRMVWTVEGAVADELALENTATKGGKAGRRIALVPALQAALATLAAIDRPRDGDAFVARFRKDSRDRHVRADTVRELFRGWYQALGFAGCSSHSGRRSFGTTLARSVHLVGGSIVDVQQVLGHAHLATTLRYVDGDRERQHALVQLL